MSDLGKQGKYQGICQQIWYRQDSRKFNWWRSFQWIQCDVFTAIPRHIDNRSLQCPQPQNKLLSAKANSSSFNKRKLSNSEVVFFHRYTVVSVQANEQQYIVIIWQLCSRYNRLDNFDIITRHPDEHHRCMLHNHSLPELAPGNLRALPRNRKHLYGLG